VAGFQLCASLQELLASELVNVEFTSASALRSDPVQTRIALARTAVREPLRVGDPPPRDRDELNVADFENFRGKTESEHTDLPKRIVASLSDLYNFSKFYKAPES